MKQKCTKMEELAEVIFARKAAGKTNREIVESFGLTKKQVKELVSEQNRKPGLGDRYLLHSHSRQYATNVAFV